MKLMELLRAETVPMASEVIHLRAGGGVAAVNFEALFTLHRTQKQFLFD